MKDLNLSLYIIFYCKENVSVGFMDALMTYDHFDLDFLKKMEAIPKGDFYRSSRGIHFIGHSCI